MGVKLVWKTVEKVHIPRRTRHISSRNNKDETLFKHGNSTNRTHQNRLKKVQLKLYLKFHKHTHFSMKIIIRLTT